MACRLPNSQRLLQVVGLDCGEGFEYRGQEGAGHGYFQKAIEEAVEGDGEGEEGAVGMEVVGLGTLEWVGQVAVIGQQVVQQNRGKMEVGALAKEGGEGVMACMKGGF